MAIVLVAAGCGGRNTGKVTGRVIGPDGAPLVRARVTAAPVGEGKTVYGTTDAEGRYSLSTGNPDEGVPAGEYRVGVVEDLGDPELHKQPTIPRRYGNPAMSGIGFEVAAGESKTLEITLESR
ncbi:MAG: carboxypeptidase regulatory-like domain-containing protein [Pirellulales bacterium]|nr:carboxypeptidase regulatory-like domain-containing protein [Pirellulales bacterium]